MDSHVERCPNIPKMKMDISPEVNLAKTTKSIGIDGLVKTTPANTMCWLTHGPSLEVNHHLKNGGSFWKMIFTPTKIMVKLGNQPD